MKPFQFLIRFVVFVLITSALIFGGIHQLSIFRNDQYLSVIGIIMFSIYTIGLYFLSTLSVRSPNKGMFTAVHIGTIFFKMVLTIAIAMMYKKQYLPESRYYILPFILIYIAFTVHETWMMMKVSKNVKSG